MKDNNKSDKIDYSKLSQFQLIEKIEEQDKEIQKLKEEKKYGLIWDEERTKEVFEQKVQDKLPVLKEVVKNEIRDVDKLKPNNILIEGDNYHALSVLNYTHKGKIDVIYIDPPYNTENDNFGYNDKWVDLEDSYKHSKWLSFMKKRLLLAKTLLAKHGVIFISIDDNEYAHLKILCDEIFGEDNFITTIIWQSKTGSSDAKTIDTITEYILVYTKIKKNATFLKNIGAHKIERFRQEDKHLKERGPHYPDTLDRGGLRYNDSLNFKIKCPDGKITYPNGRTEFMNDGWTWKWGKEKVDWGIKNDFIVFKKSKTKKSGWVVSYKNYLFVNNEGEQIQRSLPYKNIITDIKTGDGSRKIKELFGKHVFKYAKPVELLSKLLTMIKIPTDAIILDFMAGTGTSGESTLDFNSKKDTLYQFILCTNNENNICSDVCYPRLKKVIRGYKNLKNEKVEGLGGNLKYFKTAFIDIKKTEFAKKKIRDSSTEMLCIKESCFKKVNKTRTYVIFKNHKKYLGVAYDRNGVKKLKTKAKKIDKPFIIYIFPLDQDIELDTFNKMQNITIKSIPKGISDMYKLIHY